MRFTEVYVPKGVLTDAQREELARRLTTHSLSDEAETPEESGTGRADPGVLDFLEGITNVVVHEVDVWVGGGERIVAGDRPRYVVRAFVPGSWRKDMSEHLIRFVTAAIAKVDPDPDSLHEEPRAEVHVLGVPEGSYGVFGRQVGDSALADLISNAVRGTDDVPDGHTVDPACGAVISLDEAYTAEVDGTTYGFCCPGCRRHYLAGREQAVSGTA